MLVSPDRRFAEETERRAIRWTRVSSREKLQPTVCVKVNLVVMTANLSWLVLY